MQAYALQTFLLKLGHDVKIIDYVPYSCRKSLAKAIKRKKFWIIPRNLIEYFKELSFVEFRNKKFNLTTRYNSLNELKLNPPKCDVYICGSDQVWNPTFTANGEGRATTTYFLDFGNEKVVRIAYAVSFGCLKYNDKVKHIVVPLLSKFNAISVRENTGYTIVHNMGFENVKLMPDPTLMLSAEDYDEIIDNSYNDKGNCTFFYSIHEHQLLIKKTEYCLRHQLSECVVSTREFKYSTIDIAQWLHMIKIAKQIVTNSYHGVVFSIIYKKPFIAIPVEGAHSSMNDRIFTLLEQLGLQDHILTECDPNRISIILSKQINWNCVDDKIKFLKKDSKAFLLKNINEISDGNYGK